MRLLNLIGGFLKEIWSALTVLAAAYIFLAFCAWDLNPANWNGFSRFLAIVVLLIVFGMLWQIFRQRTRAYKSQTLRLRQKEIESNKDLKEERGKFE